MSKRRMLNQDYYKLDGKYMGKSLDQEQNKVIKKSYKPPHRRGHNF